MDVVGDWQVRICPVFHKHRKFFKDVAIEKSNLESAIDRGHQRLEGQRLDQIQLV